ncbi:uncharacterized protein LOC134767068 [Penaeus indicus]|uniref:uncharacterized protein LOC134767068 n=1 Tax=Penaeus indicus TaxID=29960 RepID=UPI00300D9274
MTGGSREIAETMKRRKVKILCVQEVTWRAGGVREIGDLIIIYKLCYSGSRTGRNGVGIILNEELKQRVVEVQRPSDRLISIKVLAGKSLINIVSGYVPQIDCEDQEKEEKEETTGKKLQKIKVWKLRECEGEYRRQVGERLKRMKRETAAEMWKASKEAMVEVAGKLCGRTSGRRAGEQETWWLTEEVQEKIKEKKKAFKEWQDDK